MTADMTAFLRARLDEDAAAPEGVLEWHSPGPRVVMAEGFNEYDAYDSPLKGLLERDDSLMPFGCVAVTDYDADAKYIARHDPARTLREVEAKRMIVDAHGRDHECISLTGSGETNAIDGKPWALWEPEHTADAERPCFVLRALALPYADHPDYLEEWRP
ncbi:DUF6221 family protein [Streptomyces microflavus]|uniref:DUF6221 family protein n=1 Tax=Streptomyces microflavus TaxID=1919 RepID=UPI003422FDB0